MATVYYERNVLGSNLLSQLQTDILSSTDWARPNSATFPTLYKATTTRGAQMCIDLNTTAVDLNKMSLTAYRTHDGTTAGDSALTYIRHKRTTGGAFATNTYHYILSCGKEHFFLAVEGPRGGETGADSAVYGSLRSYVFLCDLVPYFGADTAATVILGGIPTNVAPAITNLSHQVRVGRNYANTLSWTTGHLTALSFPGINAQQGTNYTAYETRIATLDSNNYYLSPYVFWDNTEGIRGRLSSFFYAGFNYSDYTGDGTAPPLVGQVVSYGGATYKLIQVNRSDSSEATWGSFGAAMNANAGFINYSPIVGVPYV